MKTKLTLLLFFIVLSICSSAQQEKLNAFDPAGKKDGRWIVYLDNVWKEVSDSSRMIRKDG